MPLLARQFHASRFLMHRNRKICKVRLTMIGCHNLSVPTGPIVIASFGTTVPLSASLLATTLKQRCVAAFFFRNASGFDWRM